MERTTTIRRRDAAATRDAILTAARHRFLRESYDNVGLRDIAGDAGVDVALIGRYFGGKEGLFREVVMDEKGPNIFLEPQSMEELPTFLARVVADDTDDLNDERQRRMEMFILMLRSASSPKAGEIIRELVSQDVLEPMTRLIGGREGELRANMLLAILMGIGMLRTIMMVDGFACCETEREEFAERFRCLFEAALSC